MAPIRIVVGPIVRYVDQTSAAVWLQVTRPGTLAMKAFARHGNRSPRVVGTRATSTVTIESRHYAMLYLSGLRPATLYSYAIAWTRSNVPRTADQVFRYARTYDEHSVNEGRELDLSWWAFGNAPTPAFRTLPEAGKEDLQVAFGSCRCFESGNDGKGGVDTLELYGAQLSASYADRLATWPQLILMLGDQIYGDNVAKSAIAELNKRGTRPRLKSLASVNWSNMFSAVADEISDPPPVDQRTTPVSGYGGFHCSTREDYATLYELSWTVQNVARTLANVPTFMLPDDHDVTDDWNITGGWTEQALGDNDWFDTIANALVSYWLYQGWGNFPQSEAVEHPILKVIATDSDKDRWPELREVVERWMTRALEANVYYTIPTTPPIIAMDARADRTFRAPLQEPGTNFTVYTHHDDQIMSEAQWTWLAKEITKHPTPILLSSVPFLQTPPADRGIGLVRRVHVPFRVNQGFSDYTEINVREADAETWFAFPASVPRLTSLMATRRAVILLAGDVHYSYIYDINGFPYVANDGQSRQARTRLIQVVSSAMQNEWGDENVEYLKKIGDSETRDLSGSPSVMPGFPRSDAVRDPFGMPLQLVSRDSPKSVYGRYVTRNNIGTIRVTRAGFVSASLLGNTAISPFGIHEAFATRSPL